MVQRNSSHEFHFAIHNKLNSFLERPLKCFSVHIKIKKVPPCFFVDFVHKLAIVILMHVGIFFSRLFFGE